MNNMNKLGNSLQGHAVWVKERWGQLPKGYVDFISRHKEIKIYVDDMT